MASGRIMIAVGLETREVAKGATTAEKALEDLEDTVKDTGTGGAKGLDKIEDELKDVQRESKKTDKAIDKIGGSGGGFHSAAHASGEFKEEALANFSEVTSSFDGSMSSIGDLAQGTLGGVAAALPGIGLAAGVAAAGIGGITTRLQEIQDRSAEITQGIIDDFLSLGDALDKEAVDERVTGILGDPKIKKQAELLAELLDINVGQAALAMAGDFESAGVTVDDVMQGINDAGGNVDFDTWQDLKVTVDATTGAMKAGKEAADAQADAQNRTAATTKTAQEKQRAEVGKTQKALENLVHGKYDPSVKLHVDDSELKKIERRTIVINGEVRVQGVTNRFAV